MEAGSRMTVGSLGPKDALADGGARGRRPEDRGSGTVLALGVIGVLVALALAVTALIEAQSAAGRARGAADLAALAGATALHSVLAPGDPCATAERVARANGAGVDACRMDGQDVIVSVVVDTRVLGVARQARASARAGPVPDAP